MNEDNETSAPPAAAPPEPSDGPGGTASGPSTDSQDVMRAFMDEYRADKQAAKDAAEAKAKADAEAATKPKVPAPKPKPQKKVLTEEKVSSEQPEPTKEAPVDKPYGSSRWFKR